MQFCMVFLFYVCIDSCHKFYLPLFLLSFTIMVDYFMVEVRKMELTEVTKFRRAVLTGIAKFTWSDSLPEHVYDILYNTVTEDTPRVRC